MGGQEDDQRGRVPLFYRKAERDVAGQRGEKKVLGRSYGTFQGIKGACKKSGEGLLTWVCNDRTWGNGFKLIFTANVVRHWHRLPPLPLLPVFKIKVDGTLSTLVSWKVFF